MKKYKHVFFDLDHTLWNFEKNANEILTEIYHKFDLLSYKIFSKNQFIEEYSVINEQLWTAYRKGSISKYNLRNQRFKVILENHGIINNVLIENISTYYITKCPLKTNLFPYCIDTLEYLKNKNYRLHIITNGFEEVQIVKLETSKIKNYFEEIITSEKAEAKKPASQIFKYALKTTNASVNESLMIGDNFEADIIGAQQMGIDQVFFNPHKSTYTADATHEIKCLSELKNIL